MHEFNKEMLENISKKCRAYSFDHPIHANAAPDATAELLEHLIRKPKKEQQKLIDDEFNSLGSQS